MTTTERPRLHSMEELAILIATLAILIVAVLTACGISMDSLLALERDCRPKLAELTEIPSENWSMVKFCACVVREKGTVADCSKAAVGRIEDQQAEDAIRRVRRRTNSNGGGR